ncbi:MAG: PKD domain-containing protein [Bacteroidia bacterium]
MKRNHTTIYAFTLLFFLSPFIKAQTLRNEQADKLVKGAELVQVDEKRKTISFIRLREQSFVQMSNHLTWLKNEALHLRAADDLKPYRVENDLTGFSHYRYKQSYKNIPVEYGVYYVHCKTGKVVSANGEYYAAININAQPSLTKVAAFTLALKSVNAKAYKSEPGFNLTTMKDKGELMVFPFKNNYRLAYKFDVYATAPLKRVYIYIDAHTGEKLEETNRIETTNTTGTAATAYNDTVSISTDSVNATLYRLQETVRGNGVFTRNLQNGTSYGSAVDFTDNDNFWHNTTNQDNYATDAHFGAEATYDFYLNSFGRNSYDNAGASINSYVHYSSGFVNAFWDGTQMTYGDGDGIDYTPLTSLDVVGHEITHAVTENTAGLIYSNESGALNESFSDIFGVTIDYYKNSLTANFLMGDQINVNGIPFRNMGDPNQFQNPDTYGGTYWNAPNEVHNNSGVQNFWYYLLSQGGTGVNDLGNSYLVNGIGLNDAIAISYRSLSVYLTPNSTYADARTYSIQSAVDLFGNCSDQTIQTTNAWYAVGVGGVFSNAVVAGFNASQNYFCVLPASVNFINSSINSTSYSWTFGDGGTSTLANPSYTYNAAGVYTVTLIASGIASCASIDTLTITNYINVTNGGGPVSPSCTPATISNCCGIGVTNFLFNTINKTSGNASEGYKDFTCSDATTITAGNPIPVTITTGITTNENVMVWIDYNNDGVFNNTNEKVFTSLNKLSNHTGIINTSVNAVLDTALRMRVIDENISNTITGACYNPQNGQAEDYTVTFIANTLPPVADFTANTVTINAGGSVQFTDLTVNAPTGWQWNFAGGTPSSSIIQNPTVFYNVIGDYTVSLTVSNSFGADSITKITYIHVVNTVNLCTGITTTTAVNGQLYDSGGPTGYYQNGENCSLLIDPGCAISISLSFTQFSTESGYDYLSVYDGVNTSGTLLFNSSGSSLPPTLTANSGTMYIAWHSDGSVISTGYEATWTSVVGSGLPPVAAFTVASNNPPLNTPVQFTDQTTNTPLSWLWDFGDGGFSVLQNPAHAYITTGIYNATLISFNCISSDTTTQTITVQSAPIISAIPDSFNISLACSDSITLPITIYNTGTGDLVYYIEGSGNALSKDTTVLVIQETSAWNVYMLNFLQTNYGITPTVITSSQIAATDFSLYNIIITVGAQSTSYYADISNNKTKFETFVADGGILQYQMATYSGTSNVNLVGGAVMAYGNAENQNTGLLPAHPILNGISNPLNGNFANHCYLSSVPAGADVITETALSSSPTTIEYNYGSGLVIATGMTWEFLYNNGTFNTTNMLPNSIGYIFSKIATLSDWISIPATADTLSPGDSTIVYVTFNSTGLNAGVYTGQIIVNSNDPLNPALSIPCTLTVSGPAEIAMSDTCLNFGSLTQFTSATDTVKIYNNGCDTLHITSMSTSAGEYTFTPATVDVAPGDIGDIAVTFSPMGIGSVSATLSIYNNAADTTICLSGTGLEAPIIYVTPDSFNVSLNACSDSITLPMYIKNTGGNILNFQINGSYFTNDSVNVLAFNYGSDLTTEYPNTIAALNQYFTKFKLTQFSQTTPAALQAALSGMDVMLMTEQESNSTTIYTALATVVQNFVSSGGTVIVCGSGTGFADRMYDLGLFTGSYQSFATGSVLNVLDTTDAITDGLPLSIIAPDATFYHNITNTDKTKLVDYSGYDVVTYRHIGSGTVIYIAFDYYAYDNNSARLIANSVQYSGITSTPPWLQISSYIDSLAGGDSTLVYVTFYSGGLSGGTYQGNIIINSNDPLNPSDTIHCTLNVAFNPCADFTFSAQSVCSGIVQFNDSVINAPTSWQWTFGDGGTSTIANPLHTYTAAGIYNVQLVACNAIVCDSIIKQVVIASANAPLNASCSPVTTGYCCSMGISHVVFNTINQISADGSAGYEDFSCTNTTLMVGISYPITVTTGNQYYENVKAWIDYNNNGIFEAAELVFTSLNHLITHTGNITIPGSATINTPLRMRIGSDYYSNSTPSPCTDVQYGQFEDYAVYIQTNSLPPVASYTSAITNACAGTVQFTDNSTNTPTSWSWTFGDGGTSTLQSPLYQYLLPGTYNVTLMATNIYGSNSYSQTITVNPFNASFTVTGSLVMNQPLNFTGTAPGATTWAWNFGDGYLANIQSPSHTYTSAGTYIVSLTVTRPGCTFTVYDTLVIVPVGIDEISDVQSLLINPNPFNEQTQLSYVLGKNETVTIEIYDVVSKKISTIVNNEKQTFGKHLYSIMLEQQGVYFVRIVISDKQSIRRIVKIQ